MSQQKQKDLNTPRSLYLWGMYDTPIKKKKFSLPLPITHLFVSSTKQKNNLLASSTCMSTSFSLSVNTDSYSICVYSEEDEMFPPF